MSEVRAIQWRDLQLDSDRPCITLRTETTKSKRADELPLHPDLAEALIESKSPFVQPTDQVFKTTPILRTFKRDLERAGIPFADDDGRTVDRHALRTTFISWLGQYGVDPRAQVMLARHAPQGVMLRNYQDFGVFDLWAEIAKLPGLTGRGSGTTAVRATGTDGAPASVGQPVVARPVALRVGREGVNLTRSGRMGSAASAPCRSEKTLQNKGFSVSKGTGAERTRTADLLVANQTLSQLSYDPGLVGMYQIADHRPMTTA